MIFDALSNSAHYVALHERFRAAFAFLDKVTREDLPTGRYELDGDGLFAMVQEYDTLRADQSRFEGHKRYIDIQYIVRESEVIEVVEQSQAVADGEYSEEKDVCFYEDHDTSVRAVLHAGEYGIFMPHDIHKPGMSAGDMPEHVKKVVVKVKI